MAAEIIYEYPNAEKFFLYITENDARPVIILNAERKARVSLYETVFSVCDRVLRISFADFMTNYLYNIRKQRELSDYSYIIIDDVEKLHGLSATLKILSGFIDNMSSNGVSVMFMGDNTVYDMREVLHIIGSKIHYIIKIENERENFDEI